MRHARALYADRIRCTADLISIELVVFTDGCMS